MEMVMCRIGEEEGEGVAKNIRKMFKMLEQIRSSSQ